MRIPFRARLTVAAMLAVLAIGVGLSVSETPADTRETMQDAESARSVVAAFPSVEAHFALRPVGRS